MEFKTGQWVEVKNDAYHFLGTIVENNDDDERYWLVNALVSKMPGVACTGEGWFKEQHITKLYTELEVEDINNMIDLALDTKDEEWFNELVELRNAINSIDKAFLNAF